MFDFGKFFTEYAITFDLTELARKENPKSLQLKCNFPKVRIFRKINIYLRIMEVLLVILTTYFPI